MWVGFDDNRDLGLAGGNSAAPIWAEFMKRAAALPAYRNMQPFAAPDGVMTVTIDPDTLQLATPLCPVTRDEVYIRGTEPTEFCYKHGGQMFAQEPSAAWLARIFGGAQNVPGTAVRKRFPAAEWQRERRGRDRRTRRRSQRTTKRRKRA